MQRLFWTDGPVPTSALADLALPRPAVERATAAIRRTGFAWVGCEKGFGQSTLIRQAMAALRRDVLVIDHRSLSADAEEDYRAILTALRRGPDEAAWSWKRLGQELAGPAAPFLALDGAPRGADAWAWQAAEDSGLAFLVADSEGPIEVGPIPDEAAGRFLLARARLAKLAWSTESLAEAVRVAHGHPEAMQRIGAACVEAVRAARRSRIGQEEVLEGVVAVSANLPNAIAQSLGNVGGARLLLLRAMARTPEATPTAWARRCGLEPKTAIVHLRRLCQDDRLVTRLGRGRYRIASPLVALHLQAGSPSAVQRLSWVTGAAHG